MRSLWIIALFLASVTSWTHAETCETNCHDQCRIRSDFPPVNFVEPTCHAKCEVAKQAACRGMQIPNIPLTPLEQIKAGSTAACSSVFQGITGAVIAQCSNWGGRIDDQHLIDQARAVLKHAGIINDSDLDRVQVRWCPLTNAHGMAPESGRIYLDDDLKHDPFRTASTLAHEVFHLRQYRSEGSENFKCNYSRQFLECGGCQDRRNRFERDAYDYENQISQRLSSAFASLQRGNSTGTPEYVAPVATQARFPPGFIMQGCGCWGFNGAYFAPEPRCQSGTVAAASCPGFCPGGGAPFGYVCR